jgi:hypothetical protein
VRLSVTVRLSLGKLFLGEMGVRRLGLHGGT